MHAARREGGVALVEFALVLPLLLILVFGFLQFGIAMNAKIDSTHLTAEGSRYITVNQNPGLTDPDISPKTMQNYIRSRADTIALRSSGTTVCISYPTNPETGTAGKVGDPVRVTLSHVYSIFPFITAPSTVSLPVTSEATMRLEAEPTNIPAGCIS